MSCETTTRVWFDAVACFVYWMNMCCFLLLLFFVFILENIFDIKFIIMFIFVIVFFLVVVNSWFVDARRRASASFFIFCFCCFVRVFVLGLKYLCYYGCCFVLVNFFFVLMSVFKYFWLWYLKNGLSRRSTRNDDGIVFARLCRCNRMVKK